MAEESAAKLYSLKDIATHNTNKSCFLVIHNNVYDVTEFLNEVCIIVQKLFIAYMFLNYC